MTTEADVTSIIRPATLADASDMGQVEAEARTLFRAHGVDLDTLETSDEFEESNDWDLALVAEVRGSLVGMVRCSDLGDGWLALDQISVTPAHARHGLGRKLLHALAAHAAESGYRTITGTTFQAVPFNGPFYAGLNAIEDPAPHPAMTQRRLVERELGLDAFGPRVVMRLTLSTAADAATPPPPGFPAA